MRAVAANWVASPCESTLPVWVRERAARRIEVTPGKQKRLWPGKPPISAQDAEQLRRKHRFTIFPALALTHVNDAARTVDVIDQQARDFCRPEPGSLGRRQRGPALQARNRLKKAQDLVGAQHHGQLVRFTRIRNMLGYIGSPEGHAVKEPQRTHDLVETGPRDARPRQIHLKRPDILDIDPIRRAAEWRLNFEIALM